MNFLLCGFFSKQLQTKRDRKIQVLVESKLIIQWEKNKVRSSNIALAPISNRILEITTHFDLISFTQIYRIFNSKLDSLSKVALSLQEGSMMIQEQRGANLLFEKIAIVLWVSLTPILVAVPDSPYVLVFLQFKLEFLGECNVSKSSLFEIMGNLYVVPNRL